MTVTGAVSASAQADASLGLWITQGDKARVEIVQQDGVYVGRIVWLKDPRYPAGDDHGMASQAKVDRENPNAAMRTRPIIDLPLVSGFHFAGDDTWTGGNIYDPESGKTYRCKITLMADGSLRGRGYVGISLFGRTTVWQRFIPETVPPATSSKIQ